MLNAGEHRLAVAYNDLSTTRQLGMASGLIPWDRVRVWTRELRLSRSATEFAWRVIHAVDLIYLDRNEAEAERKRKTKKPDREHGSQPDDPPRRIPKYVQARNARR
jgi:hypothetical protein